MSESVPDLSTGQMVEVDRAMVEDYGIGLIQMMENAGRCLAELARRRFLDGDVRGRTVVVLAGSGGNGGGALVCARRLLNWGADVHVHVTRTQLGGVTGRQRAILGRMGRSPRPTSAIDSVPAPELVIDGIIGYSLEDAPRGAAATLIEWAGSSGAPVLSLDVPSGLDADTGAVRSPTVRASATLTLALPKRGLLAEGARDHVGELYLADIGVPPELYARPPLGIEVGPIFARDDIVRLR